MPPAFSMKIGPEPADVPRVTAAFGHFAASHAVPAGAQRSVSTALDELLENAVRHGRAREVTVEAELLGDRLRLTITDDGRAFDPFAKAAPDTTLSIAVRPIGGLGIHLVKEMMDDVHYRRQGHLNVVTIEKRLGSP